MSEIKSLQGISFPFRFTSNKIATSFDQQHIRESLHNLISTMKNEIVMLPDFGTNLGNRVLAPINIIPLVKNDIREAIFKFEKRIKLNSINIYQDSNNFGEVNIELNFSFKDEFLQLSINYPIGDF